MIRASGQPRASRSTSPTATVDPPWARIPASANPAALRCFSHTRKSATHVQLKVLLYFHLAALVMHLGAHGKLGSPEKVNPRPRHQRAPPASVSEGVSIPGWPLPTPSIPPSLAFSLVTFAASSRYGQGPGETPNPVLET